MYTLPKPPSFLNKDAAVKYKAIGEMLIEEGTFKAGDDIALVALCASYQRWIQAEKIIKDNKDLCFQASSGYRQQIPEISIASNSMKQMLAFIKEFSLTPRERMKLKSMVLIEKSDDDEMEDMIAK